MSDPQALVRVLDELLWVLRRDGIEISTAQAIDVARAVQCVGIDRLAEVREAIASIVVHRRRDRDLFDASFATFIEAASGGGNVSFWARLAMSGFGEAEIRVLRDRMYQLAASHGDALATWLNGGSEFDRLLAMAGVARAIDAHGHLQLGYRTYRLLRQVGGDRADRALSALRETLIETLGARGESLADAALRELERVRDRVRDHVEHAYRAQVARLAHDDAERRVDSMAFDSLNEIEIERVRHAVRRFAERLRSAARVRTRHAVRGGIDAHRTLRQSLRTGGVPVRLARKRRVRVRPKVIVLCDVSDSVRLVASLLLEFTYVVQELFESARSFVFVSDLGETTKVFERERPDRAIAMAWRGAGVVRSTDNSNYGRVLRTFESRHLRELDRKTTVIILGDGRTNLHDAAPEVLDRIRRRSGALVWLCPEPRGQWTQGDSAMPRYAPKCSAVYEVRCVADLERAARALVARR
ncbi:MAG TPA: VWA domain-containing protein [Polyangiaceae bacterium]|jgi:hypothetical protein|nr:VWA domain-containing protein [Polyangiaceae bacterium]